MTAAPDFYAEHLGEGFATHAETLESQLPPLIARFAARSGLVRGLALGWLARRGTPVAVIRRERGSLPALLVCALPPARPHVYVLELIRRPLPLTAWRRLLYRLWWRAVENPALRRGMAGGQTMTGWERDEYARHYGIDPGRLDHVPWAFCERGDRPPDAVSMDADQVFASGRTACDWETLFAAARGSEWRLVVVCSDRDLARVQELAADCRPAAEIHSELDWGLHDQLLSGADICAIVLQDRGLSAGHVRLMAAVEAGIPVVATEVRSLEGYTEPGGSAVLVAPAAPASLRGAIDQLLADAPRRRALRDAALSRARAWTYDDYFGRIGELIASRLPLFTRGPTSG